MFDHGSERVIPVLLSGGNGSRLWPLSRRSLPKQFLNLCGTGSMLQETAIRLMPRELYTRPMVICSHEHRFLVAEQFQAAGVEARIIVEAEGRNTAFPIAVAAIKAFERDPSAVLVVLPADHAISNVEAFTDTIVRASRLARQKDVIVTLGVVPDGPKTGYGYIRLGTAIDGHEGAREVASFVEKPTPISAESYLSDGGYLWNAGIFIARAETLVYAIMELAPDTMAAAQTALAGASEDEDFTRLDAEATASAPAIAFDHAVMEKAPNSAVFRADFDWSDLGSWGAVWSSSETDRDDNAMIGEVVALDTHGSYLRSEGPMIATLGAKDLVVVATRDAVLVADRDRSEGVKEVVAEMERRDIRQARENCRVSRPWGYFESLCLDERFQVKRIGVKPGGKLSLQSHYHRAEHWVVVSGTALVTIDGEEQLLAENESVYIPLGAVHRLENTGKVELVLVEVQTGAYLGEDDIVRYEDIYARV